MLAACSGPGLAHPLSGSEAKALPGLRAHDKRRPFLEMLLKRLLNWLHSPAESQAFLLVNALLSLEESPQKL